MWDKLRKQITVELNQLHHLLENHRPLLEKCLSEKPDPIERSAFAAMLHSFYTGIENILKRVALEIDGGLPGSEIWHRQLLNKMAQPGPDRSAVITPATRDILRSYLEFRHVFRHAYTFELRWEKMAGLVHGCEKTLRQVELELRLFFQENKRDDNLG